MFSNNPYDVAFMGGVGSQTFLAAEICFPNGNLKSYTNFGLILDAVAKGEQEFGLLAVESVTAGRVEPVHLLLRKLADCEARICGEYFHPVIHELVACPNAKLEDIRIVYSHPQALSQCQKFVSGQGWDQRAVLDSASAVDLVANEMDPSKAAICSGRAGEMRNLTILRSGIQDFDVNATAFVIITNKSQCPHEADLSVPTLTTLLVTVDNEPGALHRALGCFADRDIDVVKFESYIRVGPCEAGDVLISVEADTNSKSYKSAFEKLRACSSHISILGTYPSALERTLEPKDFREQIRAATA